MPAFSDTFCCADARGKKYCEDTLPQACYGRAYTRYSDGKATRFEAPLSPAEQQKRDQEQQAQRQQERRDLEKQRQDHALLQRFPDMASLDEAELKEVGSYQKDLDQLLSSLETMKQQAAASTKKGSDAETTVLQSTIDYQQKLVDTKKSELATVRTRYKDYRARLQDILSSSKSDNPQ